MDRGGLAYLQDLFLLMVATVAVSMLLVSLSSTYMALQEQGRQRELDAEAGRLCDAMGTYTKILHDRQRGLLDSVALDTLRSDDLTSDLRIAGGFSMIIATATNRYAGLQKEWVWSSETPPRGGGACVTSCAIWFDDSDVRPARITLWTRRV